MGRRRPWQARLIGKGACYKHKQTKYARVITQCYFKGDKHIAKDPWASKSPLIVTLKKVKGEYGAYLQGQFDLVLATASA